MNGITELPIPPEVQRADTGIELARIWAAGGSQHVSLATGLWDDPASWGIMLVDLARHVARAYEQAGGLNAQDVLARIKAGLEAEWGTATDMGTGEMLH